jgi:hypothetical protein
VGNALNIVETKEKSYDSDVVAEISMPQKAPDFGPQNHV